MKSKPRGFDVLTRLVYVHAAFSLAVLMSLLMHAGAHDQQVSSSLACFGIVIALAGCLAMFGVAKRRSLQALAALRWLLWIAVIKVLVELLIAFDGRSIANVGSVPFNLLNEVALVALAFYWSRSVHSGYLASPD